MTSALQKAKIEYAIVCDDVRREDNGKLIIIGVYGSDMLIASYPAMMKVNLVSALRFLVEQPLMLSTRIMLNGERIFESREGLEVYAPKGVLALCAMGGIPLQLMEDGRLDFQLKFDQGKYRSATKLMVKKKMD